MKRKNIFKNIMEVHEIEGMLFPTRFSEKMLRFYEQIDEGKRIRSRCSAGVKMQFYTESDRISFKYHIKSFSRDIVSFDIYEEDEFIESRREADRQTDGEIIYSKKKLGKTKITIYLPYSCETYIYDIDIPDMEEVYEVNKKLLCLGDSITQGMTAVATSKTYTNVIATSLGYSLINQGVGGYIFDEKTLGDVEDIFADRIIVAYGTNDYFMFKDVEVIKSHVATYMKRLDVVRGNGHVDVITPTWRADCIKEQDKLRFIQVSEVIKEEARKYEFNVINGLTLIKPIESLYVDGLHPNDKGFEIYAKNLLKVMPQLPGEEIIC